MLMPARTGGAMCRGFGSEFVWALESGSEFIWALESGSEFIWALESGSESLPGFDQFKKVRIQLPIRAQTAGALR